MRYSSTVTGSPLSPDEIRAAAEVHRELGPDYDKAVVESFLERLGPEIDARATWPDHCPCGQNLVKWWKHS